MKKTMLSLLFLLLFGHVAHGAKIAVTVGDGSLQPGTTAGFNVSSGTVLNLVTLNQKSTGTYTFQGTTLNGTYTNNSTGTYTGTQIFNSSTSIKGTTTNNNADTGYIGEYLESVRSTAFTATADNTYVAGSTVTLTAGDWDISAYVELIQVAGTVFSGNANSNVIVGATSASGAGSTNAVDNFNFQASTFTSTANVVSYTLTSPRVRKSISSTTPYYLNLLTRYTGTAPTWRCNLNARRVR